MNIGSSPLSGDGGSFQPGSQDQVMHGDDTLANADRIGAATDEPKDGGDLDGPSTTRTEHLEEVTKTTGGESALVEYDRYGLPINARKQPLERYLRPGDVPADASVADRLEMLDSLVARNVVPREARPAIDRILAENTNPTLMLHTLRQAGIEYQDVARVQATYALLGLTEPANGTDRLYQVNRALD